MPLVPLLSAIQHQNFALLEQQYLQNFYSPKKYEFSRYIRGETGGPGVGTLLDIQLQSYSQGSEYDTYQAFVRCQVNFVHQLKMDFPNIQFCSVTNNVIWEFQEIRIYQQYSWQSYFGIKQFTGHAGPRMQQK